MFATVYYIYLRNPYCGWTIIRSISPFILIAVKASPSGAGPIFDAETKVYIPWAPGKSFNNVSTAHCLLTFQIKCKLNFSIDGFEPRLFIFCVKREKWELVSALFSSTSSAMLSALLLSLVFHSGISVHRGICSFIINIF